MVVGRVESGRKEEGVAHVWKVVCFGVERGVARQGGRGLTCIGECDSPRGVGRREGARPVAKRRALRIGRAMSTFTISTCSILAV